MEAGCYVRHCPCQVVHRPFDGGEVVRKGMEFRRKAVQPVCEVAELLLKGSHLGTIDKVTNPGEECRDGTANVQGVGDCPFDEPVGAGGNDVPGEACRGLSRVARFGVDGVNQGVQFRVSPHTPVELVPMVIELTGTADWVTVVEGQHEVDPVLGGAKFPGSEEGQAREVCHLRTCGEGPQDAHQGKAND